jgi:hypothetical protein
MIKPTIFTLTIIGNAFYKEPVLGWLFVHILRNLLLYRAKNNTVCMYNDNIMYIHIIMANIMSILDLFSKIISGQLEIELLGVNLIFRH